MFEAFRRRFLHQIRWRQLLDIIVVFNHNGDGGDGAAVGLSTSVIDNDDVLNFIATKWTLQYNITISGTIMATAYNWKKKGKNRKYFSWAKNSQRYKKKISEHSAVYC